MKKPGAVKRRACEHSVRVVASHMVDEALDRTWRPGMGKLRTMSPAMGNETHRGNAAEIAIADFLAGRIFVALEPEHPAQVRGFPLTVKQSPIDASSTHTLLLNVGTHYYCRALCHSRV